MGRVSHLHTPLVSQNRLKRKINPGKHDVYWEFRMYVSFVVCETCAIFFLFKIVMVTNFRVWLFWNKFYWFKDKAKFSSLNKLFTYHYAWKINCFLTGNLNNIWSLNNICAHFITNPNTHYFFPVSWTVFEYCLASILMLCKNFTVQFFCSNLLLEYLWVSVMFLLVNDVIYW